jgi:NAD(P)-dependent dehydrogenase (short-subunit alcohol dehydrogenase family)
VNGVAGRTAVVTGASRGIGRAIAEALRDGGATVIGTRTSFPGEKADAEVETGDWCQEWLTADFADLAALTACAERVRAYEPDILVNNAGINAIGAFATIPLDEFQRIQQVNVVAPFVLCQAVIPAMQRRGWGRIVNISSIFGKVSKAHRASYSASKFALDGLTVALAAEHTADGILANCVAPGFIDTALTRRVLGQAGIDVLVGGVPARRLGSVDEVARLVAWLTSDANTFVAGQNIAVDGGVTRV